MGSHPYRSKKIRSVCLISFPLRNNNPVFTVWLLSFVGDFFPIPFEMESLVAFLAFFLQYEATFLGVSSTSSYIIRASVYVPGSIII